jgi:hypothetical protein
MAPRAEFRLPTPTANSAAIISPRRPAGISWSMKVRKTWKLSFGTNCGTAGPMTSGR